MKTMKLNWYFANGFISAVILAAVNSLCPFACTSNPDALAPQSGFQVDTRGIAFADTLFAKRGYEQPQRTTSTGKPSDDLDAILDKTPILYEPSFFREVVRLLTANGCTNLGKGGMGSVFSYTMPDGQEVVIKLPNIVMDTYTDSIVKENSELELNKSQGIPHAQMPYPFEQFISVLQAKARKLPVGLERKKIEALCRYLSVMEGPSEGERCVLISEKAPGSPLSDIIRGKDKDKILAGNPALRLSLALAVIEALKEALTALHKNGRFFTDLKPHNIMVHYEHGQFTITLIDFGISSDKAGIEERLKERKAVGTPFYMSPEQLGASLADPTRQIAFESFDTYALAMTLFSIMSGIVSYTDSSRTSHPESTSKIPPMKLLKKSKDVEFEKHRLRETLNRKIPFRIRNLRQHYHKALSVMRLLLKILRLELVLYLENRKYEKKNEKVRVDAIETIHEFMAFMNPRIGREGHFFAWFEALFPDEMKDRRYNGLKHIIYSAIHPAYALRTTELDEFSAHAALALKILLEKTGAAPDAVSTTAVAAAA
ncbi:MAG: protein kinase [Candidatus Aureabacteria bacterium]|nr:protein kinase [Candidatus Auribacterota bacterium]